MSQCSDHVWCKSDVYNPNLHWNASAACSQYAWQTVRNAHNKPSISFSLLHPWQQQTILTGTSYCPCTDLICSKDCFKLLLVVSCELDVEGGYIFLQVRYPLGAWNRENILTLQCAMLVLHLPRFMSFFRPFLLFHVDFSGCRHSLADAFWMGRSK